ncbi:MAG: PEP/pyruvate-binding domain-containing protein [Pseudomonadota bacterium]
MTERFDRSFFGAGSLITRIGAGALGGKAQGLATVCEAIAAGLPPERFPGVTVDIPRFTVLTTAVFEAFMEANALWGPATSGLPDDRVAHLFQRAEFPARWVGDLRALAREIRAPLAVRSSSLLEDAMFRPFAGVYGTKMIPNHQPSEDERFRRLLEAVKYVWASTFFADARRYRAAVGAADGDERMAVMIQEVVGQRHGERFYPDLSAVGRSWNCYACEGMLPEEGVVDLALGLGKTIVGGGRAWSYSPAAPGRPPPFNNQRDMLQNTQRTFWAVRMSNPAQHDPLREDEYLVEAGFEEADYDGTLRFVASTLDASTGRLVPGVGIRGARLLDFAPLLKIADIPLNDVLRALLGACSDLLGCPVEIELAATFEPRAGLPARVGLLQVRPQVAPGEGETVPPELLESPEAVIASPRVLGHGRRGDLQDIILVRPEVFDRARSREIALEVEAANARLVAAGRPYVLIGPGRWGTSDEWFGLPVTWGQIAGARVIVETPLEGADSDPSQGSHFFHNVTSFQVAYFTLRASPGYRLDLDWLLSRPAAWESPFVRHIHLAEPLALCVDGRSGRGVLLRHASR